ncbi:MAG: hypothetical protein AMXMBFR61_00970 [Fimbriimonadales bacterium]
MRLCAFGGSPVSLNPRSPFRSDTGEPTRCSPSEWQRHRSLAANMIVVILRVSAQSDNGVQGAQATDGSDHTMLKLFDEVLAAGLPRPLRLLSLGAVVVLIGMAIYVGRISEAASYLSDDPRACVNCHIMNPQYTTWRHSSHARVTNCNDCHVPHTSVLAKYYFKMKDGFRHSLLFTLRKERQVIQAIPESKAVIQQNCIRCHARTLDAVGAPIHSDFTRQCTDCHREVPHGREHSLSSTPNASVPSPGPIMPPWVRGDQKTGGSR